MLRRRMRWLPAPLLLGGCSIGSLVGGDVGLPCDGDDACAPAAPFCVAGACAVDDDDGGGAGEEGEGEGEGEVAGPPRIDLVDGDGTLLPPRVEPVVGQQLAAHRLGDLVVTGANLAGADVVLVDEDDVASPPLTVLTESAVRLTLTPTFPHAGLFTLLLTTTAGAASAQVFVLQGEPGPSAPLTCDPEGHCRLTGTLEVDGDLSVSGNADVGSLDVGGAATVAGRPVAAVLPSSVFVTATTEAELQQRLDDIDGVTIPAGSNYVITLPVVQLSLAAPIVVDHPDGGRIQILGAGPERTTIVAATSGFIVQGGGLGNLNNVELVGPASGTGVGLQAVSARAVVGANVVVRNFVIGVFATDNAAVTVAAGARVEGCTNGFFASFNSLVRAIGTTSVNNVGNGYAAQAQSTLLIGNVVAQGNLRGVFLGGGSEALFNGAAITNNQQGGVLATSLSHASGGSPCTVQNNNGNGSGAFDLSASGGALIEAAGCTVGTTSGNVTP